MELNRSRRAAALRVDARRSTESADQSHGCGTKPSLPIKATAADRHAADQSHRCRTKPPLPNKATAAERNHHCRAKPRCRTKPRCGAKPGLPGETKTAEQS